jgi:hypothetical protein
LELIVKKQLHSINLLQWQLYVKEQRRWWKSPFQRQDQKYVITHGNKGGG